MKPLRLLTALLFALSAAAAQGAAVPRLAVFPFVSDEPRLGVAVADRLTHAFTDPSIPPELALGLVPPFVLQEGFLSPLNLLGTKGTGSRYAAALLRETLGVETAVTGRVRYTGTGLELELFVAGEGGAQSFLLRAPEAFLDRLVRGAQAVLASTADLTPAPEARFSLDLSSPYGTFVDGLVNLGSGFPAEALPLFERAAAALSAEARWQRRASALAGFLSERPVPARARYPLLAAVVALNTEPLGVEAASRAFARSALPSARLWTALLAAQRGDGAARARLAALDGYPLGAVEGLLYRLRGASVGTVRAELRALVRRHPESLTVPLGGLFVAQTLSDGALEEELATRLTHLAPAFAYPYERLSQRAFDRDDPTTAAAALRTATRLEPGSGLYWTNLGWAYYLLGVLSESEAASRRALELNPDELVARYNLGLVQVVTGRLEEALTTYEGAVTRDLEDDGTLDPAATADLWDALTRYPAVAGVHYALATLLEAEGDTLKAAEQYARFAEQGRGSLVAEAEARARTLRAPLPPLRLTPGTRVGAGPELLTFPEYVPGDLIYARFEVSTPAEELPSPLDISLRLRDARGRVVATSERTERSPLPPDTVALELGGSLELPKALPSGRYRLVVAVRARGREVRTTLPLRIAAGTPSLTRRLVGRGITLRSLTTGGPLYVVGTGDGALLEVLMEELSLAARAAAETPTVSEGRFAERGGTVFGSSRPQDVRDFLTFLLQVGAGTDATFAELYARWAQEGAPAP